MVTIIGASVSEPHTSDVNRDFSLSFCLSVCPVRRAESMPIIPFLRAMNTCVRLSKYLLQLWAAQLPFDTDERSQLPPSVTDAVREERH